MTKKLILGGAFLASLMSSAAFAATDLSHVVPWRGQ